MARRRFLLLLYNLSAGTVKSKHWHTGKRGRETRDRLSADATLLAHILAAVVFKESKPWFWDEIKVEVFILTVKSFSWWINCLILTERSPIVCTAPGFVGFMAPGLFACVLSLAPGQGVVQVWSLSPGHRLYSTVLTLHLYLNIANAPCAYY